MDRVELIVQITGDQRARGALRELLSLRDDLSAKKIQLKVDGNDLKRSLLDIERQIKELTARRREVKLDIDNRAKAVSAEIKKIDQQIRALTSQKRSISIQLDSARQLTDEMLQWQRLAHDLERELHNLDPSDTAGFQRLTADIRAARDEYNRLGDQKKRIEFDHKDLREIERELVTLTRRRDALVARRDSVKMDTTALDKIDAQLEELGREADSVRQKLRAMGIEDSDLSAALASIRGQITAVKNESITTAEAIKGIGNALKSLGGASSAVGNIFGQMASLAGGNFMNTVARTLTGYGAILATQGLGTSTSRFDTFRTFPRVMEVMGYSIDETEAAVRRLEQSVLGLPTSLNEIIDMARDFILLTGDLERGVDLATSINSLFVAGGANSEQVRIGLIQFRDLLSKGNLMDREWESLARTLGVSLRFIASEAGYAEEEFGEFRTALKEGEISVEDFLDAVIRAGSSGRLSSVLNEMKDTLNSTLTNLRTSFANLGATVLSEVDALFSRKEGKGLPGMILELSTAVKQQLIPAVREWIALNDDRLYKIFDWLRSFDWGALLRGIADNVLYVAEKMIAFADAVGHENIIWFFSRGTQWSIMAKQFVILGSALSALGGIIATVGSAIGKLKTALDLIAAAGGISGLASAVAPILGAIGAAFGAAALGIGLVADGYKRGTSAAKEYTDAVYGSLEATDLNVAKSQSIAETTEGIISATADSFDKLEAKSAVAKSLIQEILSLGAKANTQSELSLLAEKVAELQALFPEINIELDEATRRLTLNGAAAAEAAGGLVEYSAALETIELATEAIHELRDEKLAIEVQIKLNEDQIAEAEGALEGLKARQSGREYVNFFEYNADRKAIKAAEEDLSRLREQNDALRGSQERVNNEIDAYNQKIQEATGNAEAFKSKNVEAIDGTKSAVDELKASYAELRATADEAIRAQIEGFEKLERAAAVSLAELTENNAANAEYFDEYSKNLEEILKFVEESGGSLGANTARMLSEAVSGGIENFAIVSEMAKAIRDDKEGFNKLAEAYEAEFEAAAKATDLTAAIQALTAQFTDAYDKAMSEMEGSLFGEEGIKLLTDADLEAVKGEAKELADALLTEMNAIFAGDSESEEGAGALFSEDTVSALLQPMQEALMNEDTGLIASFNLLRDALAALYNDHIPPGITAFEDMRKAVEDLTDAVRDLIKAIEDLITVMKSANDLTNRWRGSIMRLTDSVNTAVPAMQSLTEEVGAFTSAVGLAITEVNNLAGAIASIGSMSISVPEVGTGSFNTHTSGNQAVPFASGGVVYRAGGGTLFTPRGTDTVPAMLTPGEFVLRRSAVRKLGVPILNMLNRLDIPRAIDALISRVVLPTGMTSVTYDNRRTYDNHATVNQNIYTNNPDYAYRRASRWAHAL